MAETWLLAVFVLPTWWMAGATDWWLHRRSSIQAAGDIRESLLHLLMLAEIGLPVLLLLWLQPDAWLLTTCLVALLAHEITVYIDLQHAESLRTITPLEQMVHSAQEIMPLAGCLLLSSAHWGQVLALLGLGNETAHWHPRARLTPLPTEVVMLVLASSFAVFGLYLEELWRCARQRRVTRATSKNAPRA